MIRWESAMRLLSPPLQTLPGFALVPRELLATFLEIDWDQTDELYREAYEQAQATTRPPITNRMTPYWN